MLYDKLDFFILESIAKKNEISTWTIAEDYFCSNSFKNKKEEERFFVKKCDLICKRLKVMSKEGLVSIHRGNGTRGKRNVYEIDCTKIIFKNRYKFPDKFGRALLIKEKDKKWQVFQL